MHLTQGVDSSRMPCGLLTRVRESQLLTSAVVRVVAASFRFSRMRLCNQLPISRHDRVFHPSGIETPF
jgi:hypothetical protein